MSGEPCRKYGCHSCCIETEMPLTGRDVKRISKAVSLPVDVFSVMKDGMTVLKNTRVKDRYQCFFLDAGGHCSIYEKRPQGCRYYPVIWDLDNRRVILHEFCPHRKDFKDDSQLVSEQVKKLVHRLLNGSKQASSNKGNTRYQPSTGKECTKDG